MPDYHDFRDCLRTSGIMPLVNINDFKKKLKGYKSLKASVKFSLDTNLLYHGFISNYGLIKPSDIVLVETVLHELKGQLNKKYKPFDITKMKKHTGYEKHLINELLNKRKKRSRKAAYLALKEFKFIRSGVADIIEPSEEPIRSEGINDKIIVRTLVDFGAKENHIFPVLLTADDAMVDLCEAEGLEYFKFDLPYNIRNTVCSFRQLRDLVFNMSVVFGFIKINSIIIFGEFAEKSSNRPSELKLRFLNEEILTDFQREHSICKELMELGIQ